MRLLPLLLLFLAAGHMVAADAAAGPGFLVRVWQSQDGLPGNVVRAMVQAKDGSLWVATAEGVARFDGYEFELMEPEGDSRGRIAFSRLFAMSSGDVLASTTQGGLWRSRQGGLTQVLDDVRLQESPAITQLIEVEGKVHFKRAGKIHVLENNGTSSPLANPSSRIVAAFENDLQRDRDGGGAVAADGRLSLKDHFGRTWTPGASGGLTVQVAGGQTLPVGPAMAQGFGVNQLLEDREGNVWVATHVTGLMRFRQARVDALDVMQGQDEPAVSAVMEDHAGQWWIASRKEGVHRWTVRDLQHFDLATPRPGSALFEDRSDRLWVASRDGSVFRLEGNTFRSQFTRTQVPSKVRAMTQDENGAVWFAGSQGLTTLSGETLRQIQKPGGTNGLDFTVIQPFAGNRVIAGTSNGTILLGDERGFEVIAKPEVLKYQWISGILSLSPKETWFSTLGSGLYLWNGSKWFSVGSEDGLPDQRLTCVLLDHHDKLWMGSLGGIIRGDRKQLLEHAANPDLPLQWLRLDHTDGLPSRECTGASQPAGWLGNDGSLWFPTGGGIAKVQPDLVAPNTVPPPVYLQKIRANGVSLAADAQTVETPPGRARLEFHFAGISLGAPEKVTYRARLAGLDDAWRELGTQRVAAYEAVPPGKYAFEVVAVNGDGLRSATPARVPVIIRPNFWETGWFYAAAWGAALSLTAAIGWLASRQRMKRRIQLLKIRHARESERSRIARDLHDDLGASLTEISILAALAAEDAEKTEFHAPLEQLSVKAKHLVGSLDEIVWAVNPGEDTLRSLIDYLAAYAHEFLDIARIPLRLDVERDIPSVKVETSQRHSVFLAAREALNNIVKHSQATSVMLRSSVENHVLEIRIEDDGRGFDVEYATVGNGIGNLGLRMREAGGECRIESHRDAGTVVFLTLPLPANSKPIS